MRRLLLRRDANFADLVPLGRRDKIWRRSGFIVSCVIPSIEADSKIPSK
jgi:hypothetical protein